ncbi:lysoplasmalogenase [Marmota marmota marmota]|nr:lysoplasmalogenase [Marmota marmota marmota]
MCDHDLFPPHPDSPASRYRPLWHCTSMESGKEVLLLKTLLVQHQQARRWLSPFIVTCSIYFLLRIPESQSTWVSALVRSLPVLSLVAYPWALASGGSYAWLLQGGLVCSAVGNACLMWPEAFLHGMTAFAAAHFLYFCAFGLSPLQPALLLLTILASVVCYGLLLLHLEPDMFLPVAVYMLVVSAMLWRGLAQGGGAGWGALLLALSDAMLAWDVFVHPLPYARLVTMSTYYLAQLLITLSVKSLELKND